jgi:hypothetical protein
VKPLVAGLVTLGLIAAAIGLGRGGARPAAEVSTPENCIAAIFRSAQQGDADAYRACFDGEALRQLEHDWSNQPPAEVSQSLAKSVAAVKGFAIQDASDTITPAAASDAVSLAVERVFEHHNEVQYYDLRRTSAGWKVIAVRTRQARTPAIAYGTPVYDLSPAEMKPSDSTTAEKKAAENQPR